MEKAIIKIEGEIGYWTSSYDYISYLIDENKDKELVFEISSFGGDFSTALQIYSKIRSHAHKTIAIFKAGMSASAATVIGIACDERLVNENALLLIHKVLTPVSEWGYMNEDDIKQIIQRLEIDLSNVEKMTLLACNLYKRVMVDMELDEIMTLMGREEWLTAAECVTLGLATSIQYDTRELDLTVKNQFKTKYAALAKINKLPDLPQQFLNETKKEKNMSLVGDISAFLKNAFGIEQKEADEKTIEFVASFNKAFETEMQNTLTARFTALQESIVTAETINTLHGRIDTLTKTVESLQSEPKQDITGEFQSIATDIKQAIAAKDQTITDLKAEFDKFKNEVGIMQLDNAKTKQESNGAAPHETEPVKFKTHLEKLGLRV